MRSTRTQKSLNPIFPDGAGEDEESQKRGQYRAEVRRLPLHHRLEDFER